MNYLMYYIEGFIKKFPLDKPAITIGRHSDNHLVIREDFISRNHVQVSRQKDCIQVKDLRSTNGINVDGEKVKEATIKIGESFILGKMEFFLKKGSLDEFELAKELIPIFDIISSDNEKKTDNARTRYIEDIYSEILKVVMQVGLKKNDFNDFMLDLSNFLSNLTDFGSLFILSREADDVNITLSVKNESLAMETLKEVTSETPQIFEWPIVSQPIRGTGHLLFSCPLKNLMGDAALVFILTHRHNQEGPKLEAFLPSLATEIDLLARLLIRRDETGEFPRPAGVTGKNDPPQPGAYADDMVAENSRMKELIQQTKKIAASDIFVLVHGESGTGKELFARLIHNHSGRNKGKFVAINCAAIPEQLLESELFGHEKGAFTGAIAQKKGKLEIASAGTLVLDEIGDMPYNLQSKLLRAIQEREFYRVGGTAPITVDLRIVSITNQDLKQLIEDGKFREDLYYRLVHRTVSIPPLRERREDISALINFFTHKFCVSTGKKINGYSVKAFETLQGYYWKGNIRQLENEVRSIVNLTDDGETVSYDILSEEIKAGAPETKEAAKPRFFPGKVDAETEKEAILELLEKNDWNKSQTARAMNMTYRGLHKKMQKLGIDRSS